MQKRAQLIKLHERIKALETKCKERDDEIEQLKNETVKIAKERDQSYK